MGDFNEKVIVVTGASRGIGAATAHAFAASGARIVLAARSHGDIDRITHEIRENGGQAIAVPCDVSVYSDVAQVMATAAKTYGQVDILINNAGVIKPVARLATSDPEAWGRAADINYKGVYHGIRAALPMMIAQGAGVIVNVSSGAALSPMEGWSHYCSAKAAALMLTRSVDKEYRDQGIRAVGLSPGTVATDMQIAIKASGVNPVSQLDPSVHIPADWAAKAILWLCSDAAADLSGEDFSLKTDEAKRLVGLIS